MMYSPASQNDGESYRFCANYKGKQFEQSR